MASVTPMVNFLTLFTLKNLSKILSSVVNEHPDPSFPQALLEPGQTETTDKKYTFVDLFRTPNMRKLSICLGIVW